MFGKYFSTGHEYNEVSTKFQKFAILFLKLTFYQNYINPDLVRKVITVIRYSLMFSGINDVIKFHFTRGKHKTYFFQGFTLWYKVIYAILP